MNDDVAAKEIGIEDMILAPPRPGTCPECAVAHQPEQPHNAQSLYYQYRFRQKHGRWPTWTDAMQHCTPDMRALWREQLEKRGVVVEAQSKE